MIKNLELPPAKLVIGPKGGWKDRTYYSVWVCFNANNPAHKAIFYSGFLTDGKPCGYNELWNPTWDETYSIEEIYYLEVIKEIDIAD